MKVKYIVVLFILSLIVIGVGALAKLQHWPWAGSALIVGMIFQSLVYVIAIVKVLTMKKFQSFLDS